MHHACQPITWKMKEEGGLAFFVTFEMCRDNRVVFYFVMLYPLCWVQLEKSRLVYMYSSKGYNQITSPYFPWRYTTLFCLSIAAFFFVFFPLLLSLFFLFLLLSTTLYSYKSLQKTASAPFGATLILSWLLLCVSLGLAFFWGALQHYDFSANFSPSKVSTVFELYSKKSHFSRDQNSRIQA